jgi:hypothetical protein
MRFRRNADVRTPARLSLRLLAIGLAAIGGAELAARGMGFGDPPLVILDEKIEY